MHYRITEKKVNIMTKVFYKMGEAQGFHWKVKEFEDAREAQDFANQLIIVGYIVRIN